MGMTKTRRTGIDIITQMFKLYPDCTYRIVSVNKNGRWLSVEQQFSGILLGWEHELGSINFYANNDYHGISFEALDADGFQVCTSADFYFKPL